jgi:hypothetical protein
MAGDDLEAKKANLADALRGVYQRRFEDYQRRFEELLPKAVRWAWETVRSKRGRPKKTTMQKNIEMTLDISKGRRARALPQLH